MQDQNWQFFINKYVDNSITEAELDLLLQMVHEHKDYASLEAVLQSYWNSKKNISLPKEINWDKKLDELLAEARDQQKLTDLPVKPQNHYLRWAVAASLFAIVFAAGFLLFGDRKHQSISHPQSLTKTRQSKDIPAPKNNHAILTLSNGTQISLDSASNGSLATQGSTLINKVADGQIAYSGQPGAKPEYNILTVPRGSKIESISLSDGTRVWLNSASSLKYPVAFTGKERKVEITGEAYFEVAHDPMMPFKIGKGETSITVFGTHFNINAYDDEDFIKVTLLEGSVKVDKKSHSKMLTPGQQAQVADVITVNNDINIEEVMAWKNGQFMFGESTDIYSVMRQISRWYDVDVVYSGKMKGHIGGSISRDENISQVTSMLEMTGVVKFETKGKQITVSAKDF